LFLRLHPALRPAGKSRHGLPNHVGRPARFAQEFLNQTG